MADFNFYLNRQGVQGRKGDKGDTGFSPFISVAENTANSYKLRIQNENSEFITDNLRGNAIENTGGTYVRFNQSTGEMYTDGIDNATSSVTGGVLLTPEGGLNNGGSNSDVPTSAQVYDFVTSQITGGLDFNDLSEAIVAGNNVTINVDSENETLTINSSYDLSNCVKYTDVSTVVNSSSTNNTVASSKSVYDAIQASIPDLSGYQVKSNLVTSMSGLSTDVQYPSAKCVYEAIQNVTPDELIADVPLYIKDITPADLIFRQKYTKGESNYVVDPVGDTNYLQSMNTHKINPSRRTISYPASAASCCILGIPYKAGQIVRGKFLIGSTYTNLTALGQIYRGYPVILCSTTWTPSSTSFSHHVSVYNATSVKSSIDSGIEAGVDFESAGGTDYSGYELANCWFQIQYDSSNDTYKLVYKWGNNSAQVLSYANGTDMYNSCKDTNYIFVNIRSISSSLGLVSEADNLDLTTDDPTNISYKSIDDFYDDDTTLGKHIYLDTSLALGSSSTDLTVPTSKTVYDAIQDNAFTVGTGLSKTGGVVSVNFDSSYGIAADGTTGALKVRVDGTTVDFDSSGNLKVINGGGVTIDQTFDATSTNAQSGVAIAGELTNYALSSSVPTDTLDLTNGAGFISSVNWGDIGGTLANQTDLQNALDGKQPTITGAATTIVSNNLTSNRVLTSDPNGKIAASGTAATKLAYLSDVTSNIQVQLNSKYDSSNPAGYISGITSNDVTTALGYTPYDSTNPNGYTSVVENTVSGWGFTKNAGTVTSVNNVSPVNGDVSLSIPTDTSDLTNNAGFITGISSTDVTTALGYTPYDSSNPSGYTTNVGTVTSVNNTQPDANGNVTLSIPTDTSDLTNNAGFLTSVPTATVSSLGAVQPDGTTIVINNGIISAVAQTPSIIDGGEEQVTP